MQITVYWVSLWKGGGGDWRYQVDFNLFYTFNLQRWSAYGEERYTPLTADAKITGVYLREVVAVLPEEVVDYIVVIYLLFIYF